MARAQASADSRDYAGYADYAGYWDAYLKAHSRPGTRACHYLATCVGLGFGLSGVAMLRLPVVLVGVVGGYAVAFASHFWIERNRPLVHRPVWGALSDFRMFGLALTGRLQAQLEQHGVATGSAATRLPGADPAPREDSGRTPPW